MRSIWSGIDRTVYRLVWEIISQEVLIPWSYWLLKYSLSKNAISSSKP